MKTVFYSLLFIFCFSLSQGQVAGRCKTETDKDSQREYYTVADINGNAPFGFSIGEFMQANFRIPQKTFKKKDKISFAWLIEPTGALTFLKMNSLKDDKEIESEVKRIISLMPNYAPAYCGKKKVPYLMEFTMAVDYLKKSQQ